MDVSREAPHVPTKPTYYDLANRHIRTRRDTSGAGAVPGASPVFGPADEVRSIVAVRAPETDWGA